MSGRIIAIGDIHGYFAPLKTILEAIEPGPADTIIPLGDYVDRGPQSPQVLDELIRLRDRCRLMPLLGNHDEIMVEMYHGAPGLADWLSFGGRETLAAYGCTTPDKLPAAHIAFLEQCLAYCETAEHFFVHASYVADLPLCQQPPEVLRWEWLHHYVPGPHCSGKIAIVGHTADKEGEIFDVGHLVCIDTCCYGGKWLTAMEIPSGRLWQAGPEGNLRTEGRV
jgi:serine/threonine protein phosphatase 1